MLYTIPPTKHNGSVKLNPIINNKIDAVTGKYGQINLIESDGKYEVEKFPFSASITTQPCSPYKISDNEFLQGNAKITIDGQENALHEYLAEKILKEWGKGKQTIEATILSGDYMASNAPDKRGLVKNYIPDVGDIHIYIDENLKPYSYYTDGMPKQFFVTSVVLNYEKGKGIKYKIKAQEISQEVTAVIIKK